MPHVCLKYNKPLDATQIDAGFGGVSFPYLCPSKPFALNLILSPPQYVPQLLASIFSCLSQAKSIDA